MAGERLIVNVHRDPRYRGNGEVTIRPSAFHRTMPEYAVTPVIDLSGLAATCGVARIAVKNEQQRLGLPSFKALGSSWALHERVRASKDPARTLIPFPDLRSLVQGLGPPTLCTASDGNHGRAVAALAEALGCGCVVFLPADSAAARVEAIASHGADVKLVDGSYDDAVAAARAAARAQAHWYCPDTVGDAADDEERAFASNVMMGYATLFEELFGQLGRVPDVLFVQAGVGGLSAAGVSVVRRSSARTKVVVVEPQGSDAIARSIAVGSPIAVADVPTVMACLRCQSVSAVAWPILRVGIDAVLVVADDEAAAAMRELARAGIVAGASGAAGLAGALVACADERQRAQLGITPTSTIAVVNTEGATDPASYESIVASK